MFLCDRKAMWTKEETSEPHTRGFSLSSSWDTNRCRMSTVRINKLYMYGNLHPKALVVLAYIEGLINII